MSKRNVGPAPALKEPQNFQKSPDSSDELLVEYPRSKPFVVSLSEQSHWHYATPAPELAAEAGAALPFRFKKVGEIELSPEPSAVAAFAAALSGLGLVAYFWSAILF